MARSGKFVIKRGKGGKPHFVLVASNGRIVASSETYESQQACLNGIAAVKRLAADAAIVDDATPAAPAAERASKTARS